MRVGEAVGLDRDDVDFEAGVITIRQAKFDRTRLVPLHATTTAALRAYATERDRLCPAPGSLAFFVSSAGTPLNRSDVAKTLRRITTAIGTAHRHGPPHGASAEAQLRRPDPDRMAALRRQHRRTNRRVVDLPRPCQPGRHVLVPVGGPRADGLGRRPARCAIRVDEMSALAPALQAYFTDRLIGQRAASPNTIAAYKVTFRLLLGVRFPTDRDGAQRP